MQLHATFLLLSVSALPSLFPAAPQGRGGATPPPGMVLIEGGRTTIGTTAKEVDAIGQADEFSFGKIVCETPQHQVQVDDFFLMVNEVTNEQYLAYVRAAGAAPPEHWAETAINAGQKAYLEELESRIKAARDAGEVPPDRRKFDRSSWWRKNWQDHNVEGTDWQMPADQATRPVVFVDFKDAQSYSQWAGVRLMTEFEYQRAARGKTKQRFPWGDDFDPNKCVSSNLRIDHPRDVGSTPDGATESGLYDLVGNVWEWTSSPFVQYPKWKMLQLKLGKGKKGRIIDGLVPWDENKRVAVGGSFQNGELAVRVTTRRPSARSQSTDSFGFRCAASLLPGADRASVIMTRDVPVDARPEDVEYDVSRVVAMDRWTPAEGTSSLPGYSVIESYDYSLYVPVEKLDITSSKQLDELSNETGPVAMGIISLTMDAIEPPLPAGTYFVSYLGKGKAIEPPASESGILVEQDGQDPAASEEDEDAPFDFSADLPADIDRAQDNLIFHSIDDQPITALPVTRMDFIRPKAPSIVMGEGTRMVPQPNEKGEMVPTPVPCDQLILNVNTTVRVSNKGFNYNVLLKFDKGALGTGWRR